MSYIENKLKNINDLSVNERDKLFRSLLNKFPFNSVSTIPHTTDDLILLINTFNINVFDHQGYMTIKWCDAFLLTHFDHILNEAENSYLIKGNSLLFQFLNKVKDKRCFDLIFKHFVETNYKFGLGIIPENSREWLECNIIYITDNIHLFYQFIQKLDSKKYQDIYKKIITFISENIHLFTNKFQYLEKIGQFNHETFYLFVQSIKPYIADVNKFIHEYGLYKNELYLEFIKTFGDDYYQLYKARLSTSLLLDIENDVMDTITLKDIEIE